MTALSIRSVVPWYRQRWPWLLIAGPAIVVVASFATLWLAASSDDGVIADDYYKRGLLINREIDRTARAEAMHVGAVLRVTPDGAASLAIDGFAEAAAPPAVRVQILHPTRAGQDRTVTLTRGPEGLYVGIIAPRPAGRWLVTVETDQWKLPAAATTDGLALVRLGSARAVD
jgi:uncharacterized protein